MVKKMVTLLKKQLEKLDADTFDLEAWKASAISLLTQIYGKNHIKIDQIDKLHVDISSSWALRDASPNYNPLESCKKQAREIFTLTIDELESLGLPKPLQNNNEVILSEILEAELKGAQFRELKKVLKESTDKEKDLQKLVKSWGNDTSHQILASTIINLWTADD